MQKLRHYLLNIMLIKEEPNLGLFAVVSVSSDYSAETKQPHLQAHIIYFYETYLIFNGQSDGRSRVFFGPAAFSVQGITSKLGPGES